MTIYKAALKIAAAFTVFLLSFPSLVTVADEAPSATVAASSGERLSRVEARLETTMERINQANIFDRLTTMEARQQEQISLLKEVRGQVNTALLSLLGLAATLVVTALVPAVRDVFTRGGKP